MDSTDDIIEDAKKRGFIPGKPTRLEELPIDPKDFVPAKEIENAK